MTIIGVLFASRTETILTRKKWASPTGICRKLDLVTGNSLQLFSWRMAREHEYRGVRVRTDYLTSLQLIVISVDMLATRLPTLQSARGRFFRERSVRAWVIVRECFDENRAYGVRAGDSN